MRPGDSALDATAGNGYDTAYMAALVGQMTGQVVAVDIQAKALQATRTRLVSWLNQQQQQQQNNDEIHDDDDDSDKLPASWQLLLGNHAEVLPALVETHAQQFHAVTFNLGYLPGSSSSRGTDTAQQQQQQLCTHPETTLAALEAARHLLHPQRGLLLVTAYRGHPGGAAEAACVAQWMQSLSYRDEARWIIECHDPLLLTGRNVKKAPPILWVAWKGRTN